MSDAELESVESGGQVEGDPSPADRGAGGETAGGGPDGSADSPKTEQPKEGFAAFARRDAEEILKGAATGTPGRGAAAADASTAKTPAAATPLAGLQALSERLPPEIRSEYAAALKPFTDWVAQLGDYAQQAEQQVQQLEGMQQQTWEILNHPDFQAALKQVQAGRGGGAGPAAGGGNGHGGLPELPEIKEFETDVERKLYEQLKAQNAAHGTLIRRFDEVDAWRQSNETEQQRRDCDEFVVGLSTLHKELDAQFPELAKDPSKVRAWHAGAADILGGMLGRGIRWGQKDLRDALISTARSMSYEGASNRGRSETLAAGRRAAAGSTLPDGAAKGGEATIVAKPGEGFADFERRKHGVSGG
jgi:hypothetical protein